MEFPVADLISRFRVYLDDDHDEQKGWLGGGTRDKRLGFLQVEHRHLYRQWLRKGLINVEPVDAEFVGPLAKTHAYLPAFPIHPTYDGVIRVIANGAAGNYAILRIDDAGTGTGTLTEDLNNPLYEAGFVTFQMEIGVTTYRDFETALASSTVFELVTPASANALWTAEDSATSSGGADYIPGVLAVIGVAEKVDNYYRPVRWMGEQGRAPFRTVIDSAACEWQAYGAGDNLTVKLTPADSTGTYVVRYIPVPDEIALTDSLELPYMGDERLVLGAAKRAGIKELGGNRTIDEMIGLADAELQMEAAHRNKGGLRVRDTARSTPKSWCYLDPTSWRYY